MVKRYYLNLLILTAVLSIVLSGCLSKRYNPHWPKKFEKGPYENIRYDGYYTNSVSPVYPDTCLIFYPDGRAWFFDKAAVYAIDGDSIALRSKGQPKVNCLKIDKSLFTVDNSYLCWNISKIPMHIRYFRFVPGEVSAPPAWDKCPALNWKYRKTK